jgi:hypothetical protein
MLRRKRTHPRKSGNSPELLRVRRGQPDITSAFVRHALSELRGHLSKNWNQFKLMLDVAHPKRGDTLQLPLMRDFKTDPIKQKQLPAPGKQASLFDDGEAAN